jgi:hypothetical protein
MKYQPPIFNRYQHPSLRGYNDQGKQVELDCNKGCLGEFETAFDGEMEVIADIMEYAIDNQISQFIPMLRQQSPVSGTQEPALAKTEL